MEVDFEVEDADEGKRVDAVVAARTGLARTAVQKALRAGEITVDGRTARPSQRLEPGQSVRGNLPDGARPEPAAEKIPLVIKYSDDRVLVVSKPAGLVVHPDASHRGGTLVNALLGSGEPLSRLDASRPGIVHRLDKDTSGLLLVAKDDETHAFLSDALKRREVERRYYALVRGTFATSSGTIDAPVGRHPQRRHQIAVIPGGRAAVTHYQVVDATDEMSLLDVKLETGRTHQIRVHLAHVGHPVLGDRAYGGATERARELQLERPFLHAWSLAWPDPQTGEINQVTEPLPDDLMEVLLRAGVAGPA
ncbi:MAG TPA: RluA family pseudouridine synthase [Actinomycetota bacterium]|nr:RluA family pseudouridine synthase [Actinomycetota bacterium]